MSKFEKDLKFGLAGEVVVFNHLKGLNPKVELIEYAKGTNYDIKIEVDGVFITYEVKTEDFYCRPGNDSGNFFLETGFNGNPSGINTSKSNYYVFHLPHFKEIWYIKTDELRSLIKTGGFSLWGDSGDNGSGSGFLVPRKSVRTHFKVFSI